MIDTAKLKRMVIPNLPHAFVFWLINKASHAVRASPGDEFAHRLMQGMGNLGETLKNPLPSFAPPDLLAGLAGAAVVFLIVLERKANAKKWRHDVEYGSARWGTAKDIEPYPDRAAPDNNIILTATESLRLGGRPAQPKHARNKNVLVIGGSGSGKTRFWLKPNLMQMHSSYVITDPKGTILTECGKMLARGAPKIEAVTGKDGKPLTRHGRPVTRSVAKNGKTVHEPYKIKVLNTIDFKKSMCYNPFAYIRTEKDILKLTTALIANTKGEDMKNGEDFWVKAETLLYCALIGYIHYEAPEDERNMNTLVELINAMEVREDDENHKNAVDFLFEALEHGDREAGIAPQPGHFAVRQYKKYKLAAGKTAKSILISCGARLAPFDIAELRGIMARDEMELDMIGDERTALFIIISDTDPTFNFVAALMYSQLFNLLCDRADTIHGGELPIPVRFLLDEFANIGRIPNFDRLIATIRSRNISACVILQAQSQLKAMYRDSAETIIGNMDSRIFLGGAEKTTLKDLAEALGKETIHLMNNSISRGNSPSHGMNYQKLGKELMSVDELAVMDGAKCILQLRGVRPFLSDKYDITKHKNYRLLCEDGRKNAFDIGAYLSTRLKVASDEEYNYFEYGGGDDAMPGAGPGGEEPWEPHDDLEPI